jgi:hypothetical protein
MRILNVPINPFLSGLKRWAANGSWELPNTELKARSQQVHSEQEPCQRQASAHATAKPALSIPVTDWFDGAKPDLHSCRRFLSAQLRHRNYGSRGA